MRSTIVIPAAGKGSRLNLPISKELLPIGQGRVAIDSTFDILRPVASNVNIIVILDPQKIALMTYLEKYNQDFNLAFIFQKKTLPEFTGAVRSASSYFNNRILIILPDQIIKTSPDLANPVERALDSLSKTTTCFITAPEKNPARFQEDGALVLKNRGGILRVTKYLEKPANPPSMLNAVWAAIGFQQSVAHEVLLTIERNLSGLLSEEEFIQSPLYNAPAFQVAEFTDLGTWPRYQSWVAAQS